MKRYTVAVLIAFVFTAVGSTGSADAMTFIDNNTKGYYNSSIGTSLNFTNPVGSTWLFPGDYRTYGDPLFNPVPFEPNLSSAAGVLGNWLTDPANLNPSYWNFTSIPYSWQLNDETAIVYQINAGATGIDNFVINLGVDNGIFVWMDGVFKNGWLSPGGVGLYEYTITIPSLSAGSHYLQILREDHGAADGYAIVASGVYSKVPEPATMILFGAGLAGFAVLRKKFKL